MPEGRVIRQDDTNTERLKVAAHKKLDSELLNTFISEEGGPLQAGALPHVLAATEKGQQAVLQALEEGSQVQKPKKRTTPKNQEPEEVAPKTVHQWGPQNQVMTMLSSPFGGLVPMFCLILQHIQKSSFPSFCFQGAVVKKHGDLYMNFTSFMSPSLIKLSFICSCTPTFVDSPSSNTCFHPTTFTQTLCHSRIQNSFSSPAPSTMYCPSCKNYPRFSLQAPST